MFVVFQLAFAKQKENIFAFVQDHTVKLIEASDLILSHRNVNQSSSVHGNLRIIIETSIFT